MKYREIYLTSHNIFYHGQSYLNDIKAYFCKTFSIVLVHYCCAILIKFQVMNYLTSKKHNLTCPSASTFSSIQNSIMEYNMVHNENVCESFYRKKWYLLYRVFYIPSEGALRMLFQPSQTSQPIVTHFKIF